MENKQRRRFSREFKIEAVQLANQEGVPVSHVARDLCVGENLLRRWRTTYEADPTHAFGGSGRVTPRDAEVLGLKRELGRVKRERDSLRSAAV